MKRLGSVIIAAFLIFIIIMLKMNSGFFFSRSICYEEKEMINQCFNSVIINKYTDSDQHNYNTLLINDLESNNKTKIYIVNESGGFYSRVSKGDTICKEKGSLIVINTTQGWIDTLNYKCNN